MSENTTPPRNERISTELTVGLPAPVRACLFDLDGVLTETAKVHAAAWKEMFDSYLKARAEESGESFFAFDERADYDMYVDGKTRADGARSFLSLARSICPKAPPTIGWVPRP